MIKTKSPFEEQDTKRESPKGYNPCGGRRRKRWRERKMIRMKKQEDEKKWWPAADAEILWLPRATVLNHDLIASLEYGFCCVSLICVLAYLIYFLEIKERHGNTRQIHVSPHHWLFIHKHNHSWEENETRMQDTQEILQLNLIESLNLILFPFSWLSPKKHECVIITDQTSIHHLICQRKWDTDCLGRKERKILYRDSMFLFSRDWNSPLTWISRTFSHISLSIMSSSSVFTVYWYNSLCE